MKLAIVVPCYNEEAVLNGLRIRLGAWKIERIR